ncbi:hypothetical protein OE88DRAFT_1665887 [Heliocybe sulcata]|uniref:Uncharacterized protein n=1 Tax=Heliocybe sulcata TaxID=5364 RepID=A0A5C3MQT0_9AGAM|nr:hypothetical protein OE88DRAFT_1665887 [Heliocybe sulcata]
MGVISSFVYIALFSLPGAADYMSAESAPIYPDAIASASSTLRGSYITARTMQHLAQAVPALCPSPLDSGTSRYKVHATKYQ